LLVLNQRGSQDKDLLNNAKENASFTINDIEELRKEIRAKRKHLKKMSLLLEAQANKLKELDFNDSLTLSLDSDFISKMVLFSKNQKIVVETKDNTILEKIPQHWVKNGIITVEGENINLLGQLLASMLSAKATLYLPGAKAILMTGKATLFGSYKKLKEFNELKLGVEKKVEEKSTLQETKNRDATKQN
jgi:hypothetical protein